MGIFCIHQDVDACLLHLGHFRGQDVHDVVQGTLRGDIPQGEQARRACEQAAALDHVALVRQRGGVRDDLTRNQSSRDGGGVTGG